MPFFAGDLRTGEILVRNIPAFKGSATCTIGAAGTIDASLSLPLVNPDDDVEIPFANIILPARSFLGYEEIIDILDPNGEPTGVTARKIINAGPIWSDVFDWDTNVIDLKAAGLRSIFNWRLVLPLLIDANLSSLPQFDSYVDYVGSLRTIAKNLVKDTIRTIGGRLPIDFEPDFPGTNERHYAQTDFHRVNEKLEQISGVINGPDIAFRPVYGVDDNHVRWQMITGDPMLTQTGDPWKWDNTSVTPSIKGTKITRTGTSIVNVAYGAGDGVVAKSIDTTTFQAAPVINLARNPAFVSIADPTFGTLSAVGTGVHVPSWQPGAGHTGAGFFRMTATTGSVATAWGQIVQPVINNLITGEQITVSMWVRSSVASTLRVGVWGYDDLAGTVAAVAITGPGDTVLVPNVWTRIKGTFTILAGKLGWRVYLRGATSTTGATYDVDDVTVVRGAIDTGDWAGLTADDDDFEYGWLGVDNLSESFKITTSGYPRLEDAVMLNSVATPSVLQDHVSGLTVAGRSHLEMYSFEAHKAYSPRVTDYSEGDLAIMVLPKNPRTYPGDHNVRIMSYTVVHDDDFVKISCAPERA